MAPGCACVSYYGATETPQGMGFHEGWGTAFDQLVAHMKTVRA